MYLFRYLILFICLESILFANIKEEFYVGIPIYKLTTENKNKIKRLTFQLFKQLNKNYSKKINIVFLENENTILEEYKSFKKFNALICYPEFYLKNKVELKKLSKESFVFSENKKGQSRLFLIANKKSNIKSLKDLEGKSFISYSKENQDKIWLDYILRKNLGKSFSKIVKKEERKEKYSNFLLNIYFNKIDFTIVPEVVYNDMTELNPSIKENITILEKSKPIFFYFLGIFHNKTSSTLIDFYKKEMFNKGNDDKLKEILTHLSAYNIHKSSNKEIQDLENFYDEYKKLIKK